MDICARARLVVPVAVHLDTGSGDRGSGEGDPPRHRERGLGRQYRASGPRSVGRKYSERSVVAAAGVAVVQRNL